MTIRVKDIWPLEAPDAFKLHFARWNGRNQPLDVWARSADEWQGWQEYRPAQDHFNRPYVLALAQFYHEPDVWLFAGVFRVLARHADRYAVALDPGGAAFAGRLKIHLPYRERATRVKLENHWDSMVVQEILREPYSGRAFPGYENVHLSFAELEVLVRNSRPDWRAPLASVKGVYLITDVTTGKRYIGSAYGEQGVWARWCEYAATGHGGNVELRSLVADPTLDYCRKAFRFTLLEHRPAQIPDEAIIRREDYWKQVLMTRGDDGLNRN